MCCLFHLPGLPWFINPRRRHRVRQVPARGKVPVRRGQDAQLLQGTVDRRGPALRLHQHHPQFFRYLIFPSATLRLHIASLAPLLVAARYLTTVVALLHCSAPALVLSCWSCHPQTMDTKLVGFSCLPVLWQFWTPLLSTDLQFTLGGVKSMLTEVM